MKRWVLLVSLVLILVVAGGWVFYTTGGRGLARIIPNYLMADIPDKRHSWGDFVPSSTTKRVSGFYSTRFSTDDSVAIWTLGGLRRFYHLSGTSVYYHRDSCAIWREIESSQGQEEQTLEQRSRTNNPDIFFDFALWQQEMQQEYFVTVQWMEQDGQRIVDKAWSVSGKYKVLGRVGASVCE